MSRAVGAGFDHRAHIAAVYQPLADAVAVMAGGGIAVVPLDQVGALIDMIGVARTIGERRALIQIEAANDGREG